jgi:hypothetical protein
MSAAPNESLRELASVIGEAATREVVATYVAEFSGTLAVMRSGAPEDQLRVVHGLASSSRHMGATSLAGALAAIERRLHASGGTVTAAEADAVAALFDAAAPELRAYAGG